MFRELKAYLKRINTGKKIKIRCRVGGRQKGAHLFLEFFTTSGKRIRKSLGLSVLKDIDKSRIPQNVIVAIRLRDQKEIKLLEDREGVKIFSSEQKDLNLYAEYLKWAEVNYSNANSLKNVRTALNSIKKVFGDNPPSKSDLTREDVLKLRNQLRMSDLHWNTARLYFRFFCTFLRYHYEKGSLQNDPSVGLTPKEIQDKVEFLSSAEVRKIWGTTVEDISNWADKLGKSHFSSQREFRFYRNLSDSIFLEVKNAFLFACYTGLRLGDVKRISASDFSDYRADFLTQKTKERVQVYIPTAIRELFHAQANRRDKRKSLFDLPRSLDVSRILCALGEINGIQKKMEFRISRRTFACFMVMANASPFSIAKAMGHKTVKTTEKYYAAVDFNQIIEDAERMPQLEDV